MRLSQRDTEQKQKFHETGHSFAMWDRHTYFFSLFEHCVYLSLLCGHNHTRPCILWRAGICRLTTTGAPYLWGDVVRGPTEGPRCDSIHHVLLAHPEIGDFDMSFWIQHDVVQLQIPAREQANVRAFPRPDLTRLQLVTQKEVCLADVSVALRWEVPGDQTPRNPVSFFLQSLGYGRYLNAKGMISGWIIIPNDVCGYKSRDSKWSGLGRFQAFDLLISDTEMGIQKHK